MFIIVNNFSVVQTTLSHFLLFEYVRFEEESNHIKMSHKYYTLLLYWTVKNISFWLLAPLVTYIDNET